ncbi:MAG TPA: mannose-6-phosphate isomerase, class I [Candidatus Syntrophosphaera sp.]|jgi:mannose-6-phosphate isomerase|nr:mannose-6-phosphate isomerase, class I [Candidatus Syntrophosphaera sp.]HPK83493.1 mannose-6-phosphate isomerase, class I [Candidatus Syntrophosphaera sp.]HQG94919.1 mannose-6-phosphate isomerase, class I [Candidatus Syntrophosphaera sp.]HQK29867.1 mannose-6-phosphate isomerase, class I [Candidatus Syntrophosphaera sp.]
MGLHKLINPLKNYAWGSPDFIPRLLGKDPDPELPVAEMWMGAHPAGSSSLRTMEGGISLRDYIDTDPGRILGRGAVLAEGRLPFLLKVLAAERPLSIQAHPSEAQAMLGWKRENSLSLEPDSPLRNYRDPSAKPELLCALTEFIALCGFRAYREVAENLSAAGLGVCLKSYAPFAKHQNRNWFQRLILELLSLRENRLEDALTALKSSLREDSGLDPDIRDCCMLLLEYYPKDAGVFAPLYLNLFTLQPGEALFLATGVPHAYLRGAGIEIMGNSDNVLRGGLTQKHVDVEELARVLDFEPYSGGVVTLQADGPFSGSYPSPVQEFELRRIDLGGGWGQGYDVGRAPLIVFCADGSAILESRTSRLELVKGEAAFVSADVESLHFAGDGTLWLATLPAQN